MLWITDAFCTSLSWGVEAIADLIPIHYYLDKISRRPLPKYHIINSLLNEHHLKKSKPHCLAMGYLTDKQHSKVKSSVIDTNNCLNKVFPTFNRLYKKLFSGFQLVDTFPDHFPFHTVNRKDNKIKNAHLQNLDKILEDSLSNPNTVLVISDASIKKNVATSIPRIHSS